jgi:hypothetical protein
MRKTIIKVNGTRFTLPSPNFLIKDMLTSLTIKAHKNGDITTKVTIAAIIRPHSGKISTINGINHILETIIIATISDE